jgi:8-oxo-dGTP pyrophosphatase MutT (NUDIX family)
MDRILRGQEGWQERIASGLAAAPRPIRVDPRFAPRDLSRRPPELRFDRASMPPARPASTLLLVHPGAEGELVIPLTLRHADLRAHAGEVSLPGGSVEGTDASRAATALREASEEIGLDPRTVRVVGTLDDVWIPVSNYELRPFVAVAAARPDLHPQVSEVAAIVELPLRLILTDEIVGDEDFAGPGWKLRTGVYRYAGLRIWGATARTLAMFATVLRDAGITESEEAG